MPITGTFLFYLVVFWTTNWNVPSALFKGSVIESVSRRVKNPLLFPALPAYVTGLYSFWVKKGNSPANESIIIDDRGSLNIYFVNRPGNADRVMVSQKTHFGWSHPKTVFQLPGQAYYALTGHFSIPAGTMVSRNAVFRFEVSWDVIEKHLGGNSTPRFKLKWEKVNHCYGKL